MIYLFFYFVEKNPKKFEENSTHIKISTMLQTFNPLTTYISLLTLETSIICVVSRTKKNNGMFSSSYRRARCQDKNWNLLLAFFCMMCGDDDRKAIKTVIKLIGLNVKCVLVHVYHTNKQTISKVSHLTWIGEMSYVAPEKSENGNLYLRIYCTHTYLPTWHFIPFYVLLSQNNL